MKQVVFIYRKITIWKNVYRPMAYKYETPSISHTDLDNWNNIYSIPVSNLPVQYAGSSEASPQSSWPSQYRSKRTQWLFLQGYSLMRQAGTGCTAGASSTSNAALQVITAATQVIEEDLPIHDRGGSRWTPGIENILKKKRKWLFCCNNKIMTNILL